MDIITRHLLIYGRVQGVYYRAWCHETAITMNLRGWVRNRKDGSVEVVITGDEDSVTKFITACYDGSPASSVETVRVDHGVNDQPEGFAIRETV